MDTKTITAQTKKAVAIGLCASLIGGVAAPVLSTANAAYAASVPKPQVNATHSSIIQFKDENLKHAILNEMRAQHLIDQSAQEITEDDALKLAGRLDIRGRHITSIEGIESFKNITELWLDHNNISDLKPLASLNKLESLELNHNHISDFKPLTNLTNLRLLSLNDNNISDLKPLAGLSNLSYLSLNDNHLSDITPLSGTSKLRLLYLGNNQISNIKPLINSANTFAVLDLTNCNISDITFLTKYKDLSELYLSNNHLSDITPLARLSKLRRLKSDDQTITLRPESSRVDLTKEIKGAGNVEFSSYVDIVNGVLIYKDKMQNSCTIHAREGGKYSETNNYSATIYIDFSQAKKETTIQFKDKNLKNAILSEMKSQNLIDQSAQDITDNDALKVTELGLSNNHITSIEGLNFFKNLTVLNLDHNQISDLTPLSGLSKLTTFSAQDQTITLQPKTIKVDLTKEIKGAGKVVFITNGISTEDGDITLQSWMPNPYVLKATDGEKYSATISVDFSQAKKEFGKTTSETQAEDISKRLEILLGEYDTVKGTDNYKNADDKLKQAYDTAIKDGKAIYNKLSSTPEQVKQAVKQIQAALDKLNGDKKAQAIKEQLSNATQQISSLQGELSKAKQQGKADASTIANLTGQVSTLTQQLEKLKGDKTLSEQEKQAEIDKLNGKIAELGKQIKRLTTEKQTLQQQLDAATGKVSALTSELEQLKAAKKQADEKNQQTIAGLNSQITQLGKDKQGLQDQINTKQTEINKLQGQIQALRDDHSKSDTEKQKEIDRLSGQVASLTQEKQGLQGKLDAANEKVSTLTQQLQQAASKADADKKQLQELTNALQQTKQQLEQLKSDKTKSDEQKQQEIDTLNAKIAELEKKVQTCSAQAVGGAIVAPLVNEKPTFDLEKYKREHNYMLPGSATHTYQVKADTFTSDVHAALQQLAPMAASTNAAVQATAQRTDESERAQAEQKADTSSKQEPEKTKLDQNKFPQTGDNSLLALLSTFAGALVLVLGCFARKKSSKANKR